MRTSLLSATSLATTLLFLVPGVVLAQSTAHDFSGPYLGASLGALAGTGTIDLDFDNPGSQFGSPSRVEVPILGASGTVSGGYNFQLNSFVYGIEADGTLLYAKGSTSGLGYTANERLQGLLSLRGRLGLVNGPLLVYATAGVAGGYGSFDIRTQATQLSTDATTASAAGIVYGPTAGIGAEYAVNDKVSLTAEGVVTSLSPLTATGDNGKSGGPYTATSRTNDFNVRGGIKFHL
jgi:outer membrane immunogenic protein